MSDGQVFGCGKSSYGELGFKSRTDEDSDNLLGRGKSPEKSERFEAITHFVPIYSLRKGNIIKIFAGGPHSFAICSGPAQFGKTEMKVDKIELVYTDSNILHRFIRVSLPKNKQLFERIWAKI